jgi:hypothetical protein
VEVLHNWDSQPNLLDGHIFLTQSEFKHHEQCTTRPNLLGRHVVITLVLQLIEAGRVEEGVREGQGGHVGKAGGIGGWAARVLLVPFIHMHGRGDILGIAEPRQA